MGALRDWPKKGPLIPLGSHLQEPVDELRELSRKVALILQAELREPQERFLAQIVNAGPPDLSLGTPPPGDYTDARYWLKRVVVLGSQPDANVQFAADDTDANAGGIEPFIVTAINLSEWKGKTHGLPTNGSQVFEVFAWWDVGDPNNKHYFFSSPPANFWAKLTAVDTTAPYYYAWTEQYDVGGSVLADKPGGRSGTIATHFAVNALDDGVYGPLKLEVPDNVWMTVTFDTSGNPVYRFYAVPTLTVGVMCYPSNYDDHGNIAKLSFQRDQFTVQRDPDAGQTDRALVYWNGFTVSQTSYFAGNVHQCDVQIIDLIDGPGAPVSNVNVVNAVGSPCTDKYTAMWNMGRPSEQDPCRTCNDPPLKPSVHLSADIYIPVCQYRPSVTDCLAQTTSCVSGFTFGRGFTVTATSQTSCTLPTVTITPNFTVGTGTAYANFSAASACGYQLNLCTETADVVTDVSCSNGTVAVTKATKVFLKAC
jgi:hypothetical protein